MKTRILFVDDEPMVLSGLQRMLRPLRGEWEMVFANSGQEALDLAARQSFDVVVSDMRMPGMNGAEMLQQMMERFPRTIRIILSGYADKELITQCTTTAHQFLSKPCDAEVLVQCVRRAISTDARLRSETLKALVAKMGVLPTVPQLYLQLTNQLEASKGCPDTIGHIIKRDPAMTAKVLQLVNSAFFGLPHCVHDPVEAVGFLGFETIKSLVLWVHTFGQATHRTHSEFSVEELADHSLATAVVARDIMLSEGHDERTAAEAFTGGLLHDLGKLILATGLPEEYARVRRRAMESGKPLWEEERDVLGGDHAEVGAYLLGLWGLPPALIEAVGSHHSPSRSSHPVLNPMGAVHIANALVHQAEVELAESDRPVTSPAPLFDTHYLRRVDFMSHVDFWRDKVRQQLSSTQVRKLAA